MTDYERLYELKRELFRRKASEQFSTYLNYTDEDYSMQWFHKLIADKCQALIEGALPTSRLMIFVPPQHGKSQIVSRMLPSWVLGRYPSTKIVGASYSANLAESFSRAIQRTMESPEYISVFPNTRLSSQKDPESTDTRKYIQHDNEFEIVGHRGFYKAVGTGGSLTGTSVDLGIIDDPVKDALEAESEVFRERVWAWYTDVFLTRLHNRSKQILIMTRWHEDDLAGRLLKTEGDSWTVLSIPAIKDSAEGPEEDTRQPGEALWEEKHSAERLLDVKRRSPRTFSALYQQRPTIEGGNIVKREWFQSISFNEFTAMRFNEPMHFYLDTAYERKKSTGNDPSGILAACRIGQYIYIYNAKQAWLEMPDLLRFIPEYMSAHGGDKQSILHVEPKANGKSVIQMLRTISTLNVRETQPPTDSKVTRFKVVSPRIECGRVFIVGGDWNEDFLNQICAFPNAEHDEFVDILGYAINDLYEDDDDIDYDMVSKGMFGLP